ncbi:hypothetical protein AMTRI_Chr08g161850 [Amborella trichopoda]|uniref:non-specific serine/threonine protein kinase n=1 Tax=Amborella trichopoda TaxID=13333 RepID=W1PJZ1_AMBTC|nr:L-type lectin-domain containing receptor kinase S.4 [Amborella trichopoda]ERN07981.1 hypothetical protein AMTR_s00012p00253510 [Amborella trichopoda]|eukprot:XP_006846306.1 L-type lectin-domain containing receptor kinase S.4 [Amborella trichopoda]
MKVSCIYDPMRKLISPLLLSFLVINLTFSGTDAFTFLGFRGANVSLSGGSEITSGGALQLTNNSLNIIGHAFYATPFQFKNSSEGDTFSFSASFVFAIDRPNPFAASGFAFVISPTSTQFEGATGDQYLGLFNSTSNGDPRNHVLAVEFDTVLNEQFNDINANHVGIDLNSLTSNISASAAYFITEGQNTSRNDLNLTSGDMIQVWIDYNSSEKLLNVTLSPNGISGRNSQPLLSLKVNLSSIFEDFMYAGFSASTSSTFASVHYILGWSFEVNGKAQDLDFSQLPSYKTGKSSGGLSLGFKLGISLPLVVLFVTMLLILYLIQNQKDNENVEDWESGYGPRKFSYKELSRATKGFKDEELLGYGGFGKVYKGVLLSSGVHIAVKRFTSESKQGIKEFAAEVSSIGRLRHRNLVQLHGWCRQNGELLLVYDYMPNGSLDKLLFKEDGPILSWGQRYNILRGVASALLYLHEEWEQVVIHRDVKSSNVLLDADMNGQLGDFGLARLHDHGEKMHTTRVVGTLGYLAPELARTGRATTQTDVFSYGIVLLEVASGRRPTRPQGLPEEGALVDWIWKCFKERKLLDMADPKLRDHYVKDEIEMVLKLGLLCSHPVPEARPSMRQVFQFLDRDIPFPDPFLEGMVASNKEIKDYFHSSLSSTGISIGTISALSGGR